MRSLFTSRVLAQVRPLAAERSLPVLHLVVVPLLGRAQSVGIDQLHSNSTIRLFATKDAVETKSLTSEHESTMPSIDLTLRPNGVSETQMTPVQAKPSVESPPSTASATSTKDLPRSPFPPLPPWLDEILELWKAKSGTAEVLALKQAVSMKAEAFDAASAKVVQARRQLDESLLTWERVNGQHMQLLQRRDRWTPEDAREFANLVEKEVHNRTTMELARATLTTSENALSQTQMEYMNAMRKRYHEEQIWQDQWRILSTFGTWSLIVLNSILFLSSQFFTRRREASKMKHLEKLIKENMASQEAFKDHMVAQQQSFAAPVSAHNEVDDQNESSTIFSFFGEGTDHSKNKGPDSTVLSTTGDEKDGVLSSATILEPTNESPNLRPWVQGLLQHPLVRPIVSSMAVQATVRTTRSLLTATTNQTRALAKSAKDHVQTFNDEVHAPSVALGAGVVMLVTLLVSSR